MGYSVQTVMVTTFGVCLLLFSDFNTPTFSPRHIIIVIVYYASIIVLLDSYGFNKKKKKKY